MKQRKMETPFRQPDVLVCGGGPAGIGAAYAAAKTGARTLLLERYGRLGGMAVQAMVAPWVGRSDSPWLKEILRRLGPSDFEQLDIRCADLLQGQGVEILLHCQVFEVIREGAFVRGVRCVSKEGVFDIGAKVVVDATGDGDVAHLAGAPAEMGREAGPGWAADGLVQPMTIMFRMGGVDDARTMEAAPGGRKRYRFPDGRTWDQVCTEAYERGELPTNCAKVRTYRSTRPDERVINATQINRVSGVSVADLTRAELEGRRQVPAIARFLKDHAPGFAAAYVNGMPAVVGVRETRRMVGDDYLTGDDLMQGRRWESAIVTGAYFPLDIHNPVGPGQAEGCSEENPLGKDRNPQPYDIPYGCLLPKGVEGLLTAGRCISGSHEAHSSYRVMTIAMSTGAAAGVAAALAVQAGTLPRRVPVESIQQRVLSIGRAPA